jgi:hypothetical protein
MQNNLDSLYTFIDAAEKNRKYLPSTAQDLRNALKKIELEINEEEKASIDKLLENLNQIFHVYYQKNPASMTASSIETYKSRIRKVINEYKKYGMNSTGMNSWNPKPVQKRKPLKIESQAESQNKLSVKDDSLTDSNIPSQNVTRFELPLRENAKAIILLPGDITKSEVDKVAAYITFLKTIAKEEQQ